MSDGGGGPVVFVYSSWTARYPEFQAVISIQAQLYFNEACLYCDNTACSPVRDPIVLITLLNMLTAHIAWLNSPQTNGAPDSNGNESAPPLVGRIASGAEGSVNVAVEMPTQPGSAAWFQQTKYGAAYWAASAQYRQAVYRSPIFRRRPFGPLPGWGGRGW